ncbi:MAG: hypothetical protein ACRCX2_28285 [Paraclostridium sp.]
MFYIRMKSNNTINWANAYETKEDAIKDMTSFSSSLGYNIEYDVEYHDKGVYFASMTGEVFMDGFATRECALRWLYETYRDATYDNDYETYDIRTIFDNKVVMLDLIG